MWCVSGRKQAKVCKLYQTQLDNLLCKRISLLIVTIIMLRSCAAFATHLRSPNHGMIKLRKNMLTISLPLCLTTYVLLPLHLFSPATHPLSSLPLLFLLFRHRSRPREFTPSLPTSPPLRQTSLPPRTRSPQTSVACRSRSRPRPPASEPSPIFPASTNDSRLYTDPQVPWRSAISAGSSWDRPSP